MYPRGNGKDGDDEEVTNIRAVLVILVGQDICYKNSIV